MRLSPRLGSALVRRALQMQVVLASAAAGAAAQSPPHHRAFDSLLRAYVVDGLVDYDAFASDPRFTAYLASLDRVDPAALDEADRLAFWINTYNAFTIQLIIIKGESESIRNINKTLGFLKFKGPWSEPIVRAGGRTLTLDQVEHDIIRREFDEPRIHFALVCAALGCPPLRSAAYVGARLDAQLNEQGHLFIRRSPSKNRVDVASRTVHVSLVFTRYREDFGTRDAAIGRYLAEWYPEGPERDLLRSGRFQLRETAYDWSLNSRPPARARSRP